ncbi:MAG: 2OG-Fe(II) oxygenase [Sphingomonadales bacterium]
MGMEDRIAALEWQNIRADLDTQGWAVVPLLTASECAELAALYGDDERFRKQVIMERHGYGRGDYKYFAYPLPGLVASLRSALYPHLAAIANGWADALGIATRFPSEHAAFLRRCHEAGQVRPTPLLLRYGVGDFNHLHQDLYGEYVFPLQAAFLLSRPGEDFAGGEFVLTEQKPRMQSRVDVVPLRQGDAVIFAVNQRPARGARGYYRAVMRHGVSRLRSGSRFTLGVIFHDAS